MVGCHRHIGKDTPERKRVWQAMGSEGTATTPLTMNHFFRLTRPALGRCLIGVDPRSQGSSKFISVNEESDHEIVHVLSLGEAQRAADEALDPGPEIDVLALDLLGMLLPYGVLRRIKMPLVSAPAIRVKFGDAKGLQQRLELHEDVILPSAKYIRQDLPGVVINDVPQPVGVRFASHVTPHFIQL
jgi:hypothetical protein